MIKTHIPPPDSSAMISSFIFVVFRERPDLLISFCTFRHDVSIDAIKTESLLCHIFYVRVLYVVFVPKNGWIWRSDFMMPFVRSGRNTKKTYWQSICISNNYGVMAVFSAIHCASGAPIPPFPVRFPFISSLFFEIDQGYLYVFCTFRPDLSIGAIKTEILVCRVFYVRVLYVVFVRKNGWNLKDGFYDAIR